MIDRLAVRRHFNRAAASYDAAAVIQREVAVRLAERLPLMKLTPQRVLDMGCGTGFLSQHLRAAYPQAQLLALDMATAMLEQTRQTLGLTRSAWLRWLPVRTDTHLLAADAYAMPLREGVLDMLASSLMLQWCDEPDAVLRECRRVLRPDGLLFFATLGPDTLKEVRQAWAQVDGHGERHVNPFVDMHDLGDALSRAGFANPVLDMEHITLTYADARAAVQDLKSIGATNANRERPSGLMGRERLARFLAAYAAQTLPDGRVPATFEVIYGHAWAGSFLPSKVEGQVASIPVSSIQRWSP